jgi:hypothetical protein
MKWLLGMMLTVFVMAGGAAYAASPSPQVTASEPGDTAADDYRKCAILEQLGLIDLPGCVMYRAGRRGGAEERDELRRQIAGAAEFWDMVTGGDPSYGTIDPAQSIRDFHARTAYMIRETRKALNCPVPLDLRVCFRAHGGHSPDGKAVAAK